jgi:hypothetical protein
MEATILYSHVEIKGSWAFTVNCHRSDHLVQCTVTWELKVPGSSQLTGQGYCFLLAPYNVTAPSVSVISGYQIDATWAALISNTGPLTQYVLMAYNLNNVSDPPLQAAVNATITQGDLTF